jgi:hypothetical protein
MQEDKIQITVQLGELVYEKWRRIEVSVRLQDR